MKEFTSQDLEKLTAAVESLGYDLTHTKVQVDGLSRGGLVYMIHLTLEPKKPEGRD